MHSKDTKAVSDSRNPAAWLNFQFVALFNYASRGFGPVTHPSLTVFGPSRATRLRHVSFSPVTAVTGTGTTTFTIRCSFTVRLES